jgi:enoyl-CoA hydratase/carnithine racemase
MDSSALDVRSFELVIDRGVATIILSRPARLNALTFDTYRELTRAFEAFGERDEVRAVVLRGRGRGFCAGGDQQLIIDALLELGIDDLLAFTRQTGRLVRRIRELKKPVVAAVHGAAVGAGAVIAAACDLRIAARDARFGFVFPQVGLSGADMGAAYLLPRLVGLGRASELLLLGELVGAEEAYRIGLVNRVVDTAEDAAALAMAWAQKLAQGPAFAHGITKEMLEAEATMPLAEAVEAEARAQALCLAHPDFREAREARVAGRPPRFSGSSSGGQGRGEDEA